MKASEKTINAIVPIVTGDSDKSPLYRKGFELVQLFNKYGANDTYPFESPSRRAYAAEKIRIMNGDTALSKLLCEILHPQNFIESDLDLSDVCNHLNKYLKYDGYEIVLKNSIPRIQNLNVANVDFKHSFEKSQEDLHTFINEQVEKSEEKIKNSDYYGAITNARSLTEAVVTELAGRLGLEANTDDEGNLLKLYKGIQKDLKLDPANVPNQMLKQVLSGLISIINGLAGVSNKMSDRHKPSYRPSKHHAELVVNCAKTVANFLFDTYEFQNRARK